MPKGQVLSFWRVQGLGRISKEWIQGGFHISETLSIQGSETHDLSPLTDSPDPPLLPHLVLYLCFLLVQVVQILSLVYLFKEQIYVYIFFFSNSSNLLLEKKKIIPGREKLLFQAACLCCLKNFFILSHYIMVKSLKCLITSSSLLVKDLVLYCSMCLNFVTSCFPLCPHGYKSLAALFHYKVVLRKSCLFCLSPIAAPPDLAFCILLHQAGDPPCLQACRH